MADFPAVSSPVKVPPLGFSSVAFFPATARVRARARARVRVHPPGDLLGDHSTLLLAQPAGSTGMVGLCLLKSPVSANFLWPISDVGPHM